MFSERFKEARYNYRSLFLLKVIEIPFGKVCEIAVE